MSYAGPVSRAKTAPDLGSAESGTQRAQPAPARPAKKWPTSAPSTDRSQGTAFAAGLAVGLAIGAGVALLFAPDSELETRRSIARRGRRVGRRSRDAWDDLRHELRSAVRNRRRAWRLKRQRAKEEQDGV